MAKTKKKKKLTLFKNGSRQMIEKNKEGNFIMIDYIKSRKSDFFCLETGILWLDCNIT